MESLRYPIGKFNYKGKKSAEERAAIIRVIEETPKKMREAVAGLSEEQLNTPYRPDGWTVKQVVHHVPDSHMNSYVRFKLALTEDNPTIKTYMEDRWAELADSYETPVEVSLQLLENIHNRWVTVLKSMKEEDFDKKLQHPEAGSIDLDWLLCLYDWHCRHHLAHITSLRERMGW